MKPLFITVKTQLLLMIIPDSQAHVNGHPVLTYTYNIYRHNPHNIDNLMTDTENLLGVDMKNDPRYMGYITFEQPGKLFSYTADGKGELSSNEAEEVIEQISHYRDTPDMWSI
ncbi:MAG: hypothetical protein JWQ06_868 [Mucilaginibacter sp.]|nr:hypothetical protein [Mucilaginibacter sp.]